MTNISSQLTGDELHVLLDVIQAWTHDPPQTALWAEPWNQYDTAPDEDPKSRPGGWQTLLSSAEAKLTAQLDRA